MSGPALGRAAVVTVALVGVVVFAFVPAPAVVIAAAGVGMVVAIAVITRAQGIGVVATLRGPVPGVAAVALGALIGAGMPGEVGWLPVLAPLAVIGVYSLAVWAYP